ncbi:MAG: phosphatase PAP2 family protein [Myxococcales bacterium]|nr:phosphatase PAP2 family protein [Myxococcales bacterium]
MKTGWIARTDERLAAIVGIRERGANRVSVLAEPRFIALEALGLALVPRLRPAERVAMLAAPLLAGLVGHAAKRLLPRDRPAKHRFEPKGDQSFPSTHAAHATALLLVAAAVGRRHGAGIWVYAAALGLAGVVGMERIRAAAHWPTDVLGGAALGMAAAGAAGGILSSSRC